MDPNANLEEQRELAERLANGRYTSSLAQANDARRLAELVLALDEWLRKGGFLPKAWERQPAPPPVTPQPIVKHMLACRVCKGMKVQTSTGMRTVLRTVPLENQQVAIVIVDPATASGEGELRMPEAAMVLVSYDPRKVSAP